MEFKVVVSYLRYGEVRSSFYSYDIGSSDIVNYNNQLISSDKLLFPKAKIDTPGHFFVLIGGGGYRGT